jgi:spore coat polysaccharide biosynthesis predicted glycosyltransferase SpsG
MRFIFRVDASREIGTGHVLRSSVLAEEAISRGYECIFVGIISDLDWVAERISRLGFSQILADESELSTNSESDVLILDSYSTLLSSAFIAKENWKLVLSICDEITPKYAADIELWPGFKEINTNQVGGVVVLSGADFILIRRGIEKSIRKLGHSRVPNVIIVGGGSDPFGFVRAIVEVVCSLNISMKVHVFTNDEIPFQSDTNLVIHQIGTELDLIAADADLVLTTASTSSLEFVAQEIPTGVVCALDNQEDIYLQLGALGYARQIGKRNSVGQWEFEVPEIVELLDNPIKRDALKRSIKGLVDLKGAARVIDFLVSFETDNVHKS